MGTTEFSRLGDERYYYIFDGQFSECFIQDFCEDLKNSLNRYKRHKPMFYLTDTKGIKIINDYYGTTVVAYFDFMILDKPLKSNYYGEYEDTKLIMRISIFVEHALYSRIPRLGYIIQFYDGELSEPVFHSYYDDVLEGYHVNYTLHRTISKRIEW